MNFLYSSGVVVAKSVGQIFATSKKSKDFFSGRKLIWDELKKIPKTKKVIWMHCASLGEYEQGFPILDSLKNQKKDFFIWLLFSLLQDTISKRKIVLQIWLLTCHGIQNVM